MVGAMAVDGRAVVDAAGLRAGVQGVPPVPAARKAVEIEAAFGVRLVCPVDEFNASRHVGDDSPAPLPPPTPERLVGVLRLPQGTDRDGPQVRAGGAGLCPVPDAVSRRAALG